MIMTAYLLSFLRLILNCSLFIRIKPPYGWFLQMLSHALSPILVVMGGLGAGLGWPNGRAIMAECGLFPCPALHTFGRKPSRWARKTMRKIHCVRQYP